MPISYTVKEGDTLNGIASSYGYSNYKDAGVSSVKSGNFDLITPGETINLGNANKTVVEPGIFKVGNVYQDASGKTISYSPAMQTTSQQTRLDATTGQKIDAISGANPNAQTNGQNNNGQVVTNNNTGQPQTGGTNPDGTPKTTATPINYQSPDGTTVSISETAPTNSFAYSSPTALGAGEKFGYGSDGKRYIIGKDGSIKNDTYADQEFQANKLEIDREKERTALFDSMKSNLDSAHSQLLDSIKATFQVRRQKMQDINSRYLALKTNEGFSGGQARYMSDVNNGVLQDEEQKGEVRLAEIDAQEKQLVAQAVQAKSSKDFELATKKLDEIDRLQKEKQDTIQKVYKAAVDYNKALDEQAKEVRLKQKEQFDMSTKALVASAPALVKSYDTLKSDVEKQAFITAMAKKLGVSEEVVLGSMEDQRTQNDKTARDTIRAEAELKQTYAQTDASNRSNRPKAKDTTVDEFGNETTDPKEIEKIQKTQDFFGSIDKMMASNFKNSAGVPVVTKKGYITYDAFKDLLATAIEMGITREEFLNRYQSKLNLSTFSGGQKGYGLTDAEYTKIKKSN